ncbi:hypothetical protein GCM10009612_19130 [Streptomyces beijiangensis]
MRPRSRTSPAGDSRGEQYVGRAAFKARRPQLYEASEAFGTSVRYAETTTFAEYVPAARS